MPDYGYRITDIVTYDDESAYEIEFEQRENIEMPLFKGIIYINTVDFGFCMLNLNSTRFIDTRMKDSLYQFGTGI